MKLHTILKQITAVCLLLVPLGCYQGVEVPLHGVLVALPESTPIEEVTDKLPPDVYIRAVMVEFEPGKSGRLVLPETTRSADIIVQNATSARGNLHEQLVKDLARGHLPVDDSEAEAWNRMLDLEIEQLRENGEVTLTTETLYVSSIYVDGPQEQISDLTSELKGNNP